MQCKAKSKQSGERCKRHATPGKEVCRMHGGKTPIGFANPNTKTAKYSRDLATRLASRYEEARKDAELLTLHEEVALTDARIFDLLAKVDTGESGAKWKLLRKVYNELIDAITSGDSTLLMATVRKIGTILDEGIHDVDLWVEVFATVEQRRKLVESERKRLDQMEQLVTVSEMMVLASALLSSVQSHVSDRRTLAAISADFNRLTTLDRSSKEAR